ncbi:calcium-activated potassium channel subunit alpha-1-like isoform X7 [Bolinopsis microptera]|uniref:calcium-activated potassium channel subunit alpha-1-like isoform X7 n=1 Tax=Bolinopsis microptera TaxID=2820187 RepID=UPI003079B03E
MGNNNGNALSCRPDRVWIIFIISSVAPFVGGLVAIMSWRMTVHLIRYCKMRKRRRDQDSEEIYFSCIRFIRRVYNIQRRVVQFAEDISYPKTKKGRAMTWVQLLMNLIAIGSFAAQTPADIERCVKLTEITIIVDLICNIFFLWRFVVMYIVSKDKLCFWVEIGSLIDFCTIPPALVTFGVGKTWLGLRFVRCLKLLSFGDDIAAVKLISSHKMLTLSRTLCQFVSFWLTAAGLYFLVARMSDSGNKIHFFECMYFLLVTITTIGYGDIHPMTLSCQIIVIFIIAIGVAVFASFGPAVIEMFKKSPPYVLDYDDSKSSHVVVCGYINTSTVSNFMRDFLHPENEDHETTAVFLNTIPPPEDLQNLMHRNFYRCQYYQGSPLRAGDLARVKLSTAKACLVIANKHSAEPDAEDAANILRVISIKNYKSDVRVIIQILNYHNEEHLFNVPDWNHQLYGDEVICINELKLGLLGKSCLCPGFSTMIANLIMMSSFHPSNYSKDVRSNWEYEYGYGASNELYTGSLSSDFLDMTFPEVAEICLIKLHILLIGVETNSSSTGILFNPSPHVFRFKQGTQGIFIAQNPTVVKSAALFCFKCHEYAIQSEIVKCTCDKSDSGYTNNRSNSNSTSKPKTQKKKKQSEYVPYWKRLSQEERAKMDERLTLDGSGTFHWRESCLLEEVTMTKEDVATLTDHIIVCVFGDNNAPTVGLRNLLLPLRNSNLPSVEVKKVLLLGKKEYIEKEWKDIDEFQDVYFMEGSPIRREDVISAGVQNCLMCLILSSALQSKATDPNLVDKETILSFLQIKGCRGTESTDTPNTTKYRLSEKPIRNRAQIPIISEIVNDSNVQFMEKSKDSGVGALYMALPFTRGQAFIVSVLDAILSLTFYNEKLMSIIRTLITGIGNSHKNETADNYLPENSEEDVMYYQPWLRTRMSCRIAQISLRDERFSRFRVYGELFVYLLHNYSMLALGLYRSYQWANKGIKGKSTKARDNHNEDRYVTTAPSYDAKLRPNDKVFVLAQSEMELPFPLEMGKNEMDGSDDDGMSYQTSRETSPPASMRPMSDVSVPIAVEEIQPVTQPSNPGNNTDEPGLPVGEPAPKGEDLVSHTVELPAVYTTDNSETLKAPNNASNDIAHLIA